MSPHRHHRHESSLEILTDGSELTGGPAIFLTIRRYASQHRRHQSQTKETHKQSFGIDQVSSAVKTDPRGKNKFDGYDIYYQKPRTSHNIQPHTHERGHEENDHKEKDSSTSESNDINSPKDEGIIVARYNLTGLPSLTGRLSSDQSFKLLHGGAFRAVLLPSLVSYMVDSEADRGWTSLGGFTRGASVGGLASFFLNLIQSGYKVSGPEVFHVGGGSDNGIEGNAYSKINGGSDSYDVNSDSSGNGDFAVREKNNAFQDNSAYNDVSIIGPPGTNVIVDGILDTIFEIGRNRPSIRVCEVPAAAVGSGDGDGGGGTCWWDVYQDSYIRIWAKSVSHCHSSWVCETCKASKERNEMDEESLSASSCSSSEPEKENESADDHSNEDDDEEQSSSSFESETGSSSSSA